MTNEELLAARYKVIADYPLSDKYFKVGEILLWSIEGFYYAEKCKMHKTTVESYPHLFKKLPWWSERKVDDMPEYLKYVGSKKDGEYNGVQHNGVYKVFEWGENRAFILPSKFGLNLNSFSFVPATLEEYNEYQSLNQIN